MSTLHRTALCALLCLIAACQPSPGTPAADSADAAGVVIVTPPALDPNAPPVVQDPLNPGLGEPTRDAGMPNALDPNAPVGAGATADSAIPSNLDLGTLNADQGWDATGAAKGPGEGKRGEAFVVNPTAVTMGPFKLGDTLAGLMKAGHKLEPHPSGQMDERHKVSGPFMLIFNEQGRLISIELDLSASDARYRDKVITKDTPIEQIRKLMGCGELEILEGGNVAACDGGLQVMQSGPILKPSLRIQEEPTGPKPSR